MVKTNLQRHINQQLFEKLELAYFCVDSSMQVVDASENLSNYGYEGVLIGANIEDCVDFMFGLSVDTQLDLPMVETPSGVKISVNLLPRDDLLTVLISNATTYADQSQLLQQKANENELLVGQQIKLMQQLERTSDLLEQRNIQLEEASRLQTSFLSGVSHEFRTPLTSILGYTDLVKQALESANDARVENVNASVKSHDKVEHLRAVQRSSKHLLSLVENLLDHGKLDSDEIVVRPKANDLGELFNDVELLLKPLSDTKHIELIFKLAFEQPMVVVTDDSRLRQCLINIVGNAIKFTDTGSVTLDALLSDEFLRIRVTDTGLGISEEDLERIRLPFWQAADTGKAGTGLGLTITERIVELMGGELNIESQVGKGTTVCFEIPAPQFHDIAESSLAVEPVAYAAKVLLAEDDSDIADLILMMLSERGYQVTHVDNGLHALEALESESYDFTLMDIHMPVMTGYEVLAALQKKNISVPVAIMSASAVESAREKAEKLGCFDYLIKPVEIDDVVRIINNAVESST